MQWMSFFPRDTVLAVLEYLHGQKPPVYYGDLKPDNLVTFRFGQIVSGGFWERGVWIWRKSADLYGTEGFAAPEQYGKSKQLSDLYALEKHYNNGRKNWLSVFGKFLGLLCFSINVPGLREKDDLKMQHRQEKCFLV